MVAKAIKTGRRQRAADPSGEGRTAFTGIVNVGKRPEEPSYPIPLKASKGVPGSGAAALGLASANQPFFDLRLSGVKPAPKGSAYIVWFVFA